MRRELYTSAAIHVGILLWVALGDSLFRDSEPVDFQVTGVSIISTSEFAAMTAAVQIPQPPVSDAPDAPQPAPEAETPTAPEPEAAAPEVTQPAETAPPAAEAAPDVAEIAPLPDTQVTDQVAALPAPPAGDPTAPLSDSPVPQQAPRVAPTPAPAPAPEVETAPEVIEQPTTDAPSEAPVEEVAPTAPEEATTEIVTEAEEPSQGAAAPLASVRPTSRPNRPEPVAEPVETAAPAPETPTPAPTEEAPSEDALASAIAAAVAEAASSPAPAAPATPSGPPLTAGQRDGFRIAVQACWNVGSLSSDALQTTVTLGVEMARDGRPEQGSIRLLESSGGSDAGARQAFEAARRAIIRCGANGFDLPEESYDHWRSVEMVFNPEGMRLR